MKILIVDDEPKWINFCREVLDDTTLDLDDDYDFIILSARFLEFQTGKPFVVATSQMTKKEAIMAYQLGARNYFAKDFRKDKLLEHLS